MAARRPYAQRSLWVGGCEHQRHQAALRPFASMKAGPWILSPEQMLQRLKLREEHWGEGVLIAANCPSQAKNEAFVRAAARLERASASPASIVTLSRANHELDVLHVLSSIHVPTLILHRKGDSMVPVACGR